MGERSKYTPGTFCWTDLSAADQDAAKKFYTDLFGWESADLPVGDGAVYSMMRVNGKDVAAISSQPQQQRDAGVPPLWNSYVSVESADKAADKAATLGATVHAPPFDVLESGRMAVIQDPQGAFFMVWQPRQHFGAALVNAPGALVWNELASPDVDASTAFYGELFGWKFRAFEGGAPGYHVIQNGDSGNGGIRNPNPSEPPNWSVYFGTDDVEKALKRVEDLGGKRMMPEPIDIQIAKVGVVQDPQGALFQLYAGELQP